jgi:hypothetical protein
MKRYLALAVIMAPIAFAAASSHAAPTGSFVGTRSQVKAVTEVQWGRCGYWRQECAWRWPGLGWRFRRCLYIRGCGGW